MKNKIAICGSKVLICLLLSLELAFGQNIYIDADGTGTSVPSIFDKFITNPISNNIGVFSNFSFTVCAILGFLGAYKVYNKIQTGDDDVKPLVYRWFGAFIAVLITASALKFVAQNQKATSNDGHMKEIIKD